MLSFSLKTRRKTPDEELVAGCLKQDPKAQREFYERFAAKMTAVCVRYCSDRQDAEDCVIEGFEKIFRQLESYRSDGSLEGWVRRIMVRQALMVVRRRTVLFVEAETAQDTALNVEPEVLDRFSTDELLDMVARLPEGYRMVFNLNVVEGYSHEEIGQMLGITAVTSRSQLSRAKALLQKRLTQTTKQHQMLAL